MGRVEVDGGWAWVVLAASFGGMLINGSIIYSSGIIQDAMLEEIDSDVTKISWINALRITIMCTCGPFVGMVINKFGCRVAAIIGGLFNLIGMTGAYFSTDAYTLIPTYCVLGGLGMGFGLGASVVVSGYYFEKRRAIASGITVSGAGCGMFIGPPLVRFVIDQYSLRGFFQISGAFCFNYCVVGMLMRPSPTERKLIRNSSGCFFNPGQPRPPRSLLHRASVVAVESLQILKNGPFLAYLFSIMAWTAGDMAVIMHLPTYVAQQGTTRMQAATLMTAMGITNLPSRLLAGFAASDEAVGPGMLNFGMMGLLGILTITFPLYSFSFGTQVLYTAGYGMYCGGINSLANPLAVQLVGLEKLATAFGLLSFMSGVGALVGTPIAGIIVDSSGSYTYSYIYAGALHLTASFVSAFICFGKNSVVRSKNMTKEVKADEDLDDVNNEMSPLASDDNEIEIKLECKETDLGLWIKD